MCGVNGCRCYRVIQTKFNQLVEENDGGGNQLERNYVTVTLCVSAIVACTCVATQTGVTMAGRFNIYSQLLISAIRIADINNSNQTIADITNCE